MKLQMKLMDSPFSELRNIRIANISRVGVSSAGPLILRPGVDSPFSELRNISRVGVGTPHTAAVG